MQKSLEVRTPLVQNGADEHGPDRGDITVEWAQIGRLNGDTGNLPLVEFPDGQFPEAPLHVPNPGRSTFRQLEVVNAGGRGKIYFGRLPNI